MRILVTGAPGWLGSRFVEVLRRGWDGETGDLPAPPACSVRCLVLRGQNDTQLRALGCEIVYGDVAEKESLKPALRDVDCVFHLVGLIHPRRIRDLFLVNSLGTKNMVEAALKAKVRKFIYVSSNSPAGHNTGWNRPMREEDPVRPYKAYGKSKLLAEQEVQRAALSGGMETVVLRSCWYYGPGQPLRQTRFFTMIKSGRPIFFGGGRNQRSMAYIDNVVQALLLAERSSQANGKIYWVTDERPYSTLEIYQTVADLLGVRLAPRFVPAATSTLCEFVDGALQRFGLYSPEIHVAGEMAKDISCSVEKAKRELGYRPAISLREGMRRSIEWCRTQGIPI